MYLVKPVVPTKYLLRIGMVTTFGNAWETILYAEPVWLQESGRFKILKYVEIFINFIVCKHCLLEVI